MVKAFGKRVKPQSFQEGDLVLKKVLPNVQDPRGKFTPNCEGSYIVKKVLSGRAMVLSQMDGLDLKDPINSDAIKMYYS